MCKQEFSLFWLYVAGCSIFTIFESVVSLYPVNLRWSSEQSEVVHMFYVFIFIPVVKFPTPY